MGGLPGHKKGRGTIVVPSRNRPKQLVLGRQTANGAPAWEMVTGKKKKGAFAGKRPKLQAKKPLPHWCCNWPLRKKKGSCGQKRSINILRTRRRCQKTPVTRREDVPLGNLAPQEYSSGTFRRLARERARRKRNEARKKKGS